MDVKTVGQCWRICVVSQRYASEVTNAAVPAAVLLAVPESINATAC